MADDAVRRGGLTPARVTLATVAEALGVSTMTVSNAYNRPEKLSAELRERILAKADELGYAGPERARPLAAARATGRARGRARRGAGLRLRGPGDGRVLARAGLAGIALHLVPATGCEGDAALVLDAAVDAFVLYAVPDGHPLVDAVLRRRLPVVVQSGPQLEGHPFVAIDERAAAAAAAEHLRALGHTRLAVLCLPFSRRRPRRPAAARRGAGAPRHPRAARGLRRDRRARGAQQRPRARRGRRGRAARRPDAADGPAVHERRAGDRRAAGRRARAGSSCRASCRWSAGTTRRRRARRAAADDDPPVAARPGAALRRAGRRRSGRCSRTLGRSPGSRGR